MELVQPNEQEPVPSLDPLRAAAAAAQRSDWQEFDAIIEENDIDVAIDQAWFALRQQREQAHIEAMLAAGFQALSEQRVAAAQAHLARLHELAQIMPRRCRSNALFRHLFVVNDSALMSRHW